MCIRDRYIANRITLLYANTTFYPMKLLFLLFVLVSYNTFCQPVYLANEVSQPAEPSGGTIMLTAVSYTHLDVYKRQVLGPG